MKSTKTASLPHRDAWFFLAAFLVAPLLILESCREQGCALLLITHSISQAKRIADRALVLHGGGLVEQGPGEQVLYAPREELTRRFLEFYGL